MHHHEMGHDGRGCGVGGGVGWGRIREDGEGGCPVEILHTW